MVIKTEIEVVEGGLLRIETIDGEFTIWIDIKSGEVTDLSYLDGMTIHQLASRITKAKTRYNKFINSKAIDDFIN